MITGMVVWGNGEKCPLCGKDVPDGEHMNHLEQFHMSELMEVLYPDEGS